MSYQLRLGAAAALVCSSLANAGTLTIESWRVDDKAQWDEVLLYDESSVFREHSARHQYTGITRAAEKVTVVV